MSIKRMQSDKVPALQLLDADPRELDDAIDVFRDFRLCNLPGF